MVEIRPAPFVMGSDERDAERDSDEEPRTVAIGRAFSMSTMEVTIEQFCAFQPEFRNHFLKERMPENGEPVCVVSLFEAMAYCRWLSDKEELDEDEKCYPPVEQIKAGMRLPAENEIRNKTGYRLPMEDEWEYAARGGTTGSRFFGSDQGMLPRYDWFIEFAHGHPQRCGMLLPNEFGLFDMLGNVKEWCQDVYRDDSGARREERRLASPESKERQVTRGGGFLDQARTLRATNRFPSDPNRGHVLDRLSHRPNRSVIPNDE